MFCCSTAFRDTCFRCFHSIFSYQPIRFLQQAIFFTYVRAVMPSIATFDALYSFIVLCQRKRTHESVFYLKAYCNKIFDYIKSLVSESVYIYKEDSMQTFTFRI